MVVKLDVYPYDVEVKNLKPELPYFPEYADHLLEAMYWLGSMSLEEEKQWKFSSMNGSSPAVISFKRQKDALLFKMAFG